MTDDPEAAERVFQANIASAVRPVLDRNDDLAARLNKSRCSHIRVRHRQAQHDRCTADGRRGVVVISVLLLSANLYQAGNPMALLLPFVLGIGMALPWPFAGAGMSFLPKPGAWMTKIKYALYPFSVRSAALHSH